MNMILEVVHEMKNSSELDELLKGKSYEHFDDSSVCRSPFNHFFLTIKTLPVWGVQIGKTRKYKFIDRSS